jgi:hypothetical protein
MFAVRTWCSKQKILKGREQYRKDCTGKFFFIIFMVSEKDIEKNPRTHQAGTKNVIGERDNTVCKLGMVYVSKGNRGKRRG